MTVVRISLDRLEAFLELEGPGDLSAVVAELNAAGVSCGIDKPALAKAIEHGTGGEETCIARGTAPIPSRPAHFELEFQRGKKIGKINTGSLQMDYRERGGVHSVGIGDRLGVLQPALAGSPGMGVDGEAIEQEPSGEPEARIGAAVRKVEGEGETLTLFAEIDGVVKLDETGELYVTDLLETKGDVDLETGNIDVRGSVHVHGTVRSKFSVVALEDVTVDSAVEEADIKAGKSITIGAGILGGGGGVVQAGGSIAAKFAQNSILRCRGDVVLQVDTGSTIECGGSLLAREGAGHLRGGTYWAGAGVWARELGSVQGVPTSVRVGSDPNLIRELARVRTDFASNQGKLKKLQRERGAASAKRRGQTLDRDQAGSARRAMKAQRELMKVHKLLEKQQQDLEAALASPDPPYVRVEQRIHAGVQLQIQDAHLYIEHSRPGGTFKRDAETGEISAGS